MPSSHSLSWTTRRHRATRDRVTPSLGTFLSPDTLVPDPGAVIDYNRFLYVRGNPLKFSDPSGNEPSGPQFDGGGSCLMPGSCWSSQGWVNDNSKEPSLTPGQRQAEKIPGVAAQIVQTLLPPGASSVGIMGSVGMGLDLTGDVGFVYFDEFGDVIIGGASLGIGGNTGANADLGFYVQNLPAASSVDIFDGWTVNAGITGGEGLGAGIEVNAVRDPETSQPVLGATINGGISAKANIPIPPIEFYGNASHTWLSPLQFNLYDLLEIPRP